MSLLSPFLGSAAVRLRRRSERSPCDDPDERRSFSRPPVIISLSPDFFERWLMSGWMCYRKHLRKQEWAHTRLLPRLLLMPDPWQKLRQHLDLASTWEEAASQPWCIYHVLCVFLGPHGSNLLPLRISLTPLVNSPEDSP